MLLKKNYMDVLNNTYDFCTTGCDYLTFNFTNNSKFQFLSDRLLSKFFSNIFLYNFTNSNTRTFLYNNISFSVTALDFSSGKAYVVNMQYIDSFVPYLLFYDYSDTNKGNTKYNGQIHLYGTFFRLREIGVNFLYDKIVDSCFDSNMILSRTDIKNDFVSKKFLPSLVPMGDILNANKNDIYPQYQNGLGHISSWRHGKNKNGRKVIRMYNKFIDIERVGNQALYLDKFSFATFHRLEFQLMYKEVNYIKNRNQLEDLIFSYSVGLPKTPIYDKIQYIKENVCIVKIESSMRRLFVQIRKSGLPFSEMLFYSLIDSGFSLKELEKFATELQKNIIDSAVTVVFNQDSLC